MINMDKHSCKHKWNDFPKDNPRYVICTKCGAVESTITNADVIRNMSTKDLAESRIYSHYDGDDLVFIPIGARGVYYDKQFALEAEIEWLNRRVQ